MRASVQLCLIVFFVVEITSMPVEKGENGQFIDISSRHNSDFNRLPMNAAGYDGNDAMIDGAGSSADYGDASEDIDTAEFRHRMANRRRPCVPTYGKQQRKQQRQQYRQNQQQYVQNQQYRDSARTLYDLNFYFVGYPPNGGTPNKVQNTNPDVETFQTAAATHGGGGGGTYNTYGGYDCSPNPLYQSNYVGGSNFGGNYANAAYNDPNRPGTWGQVGQSLYEFFNGLLGTGGQAANAPFGSQSAALNDPQIGNNVRPIFELNIPDTIQALVKRCCTHSTHTHSYTTYNRSTCWTRAKV